MLSYHVESKAHLVGISLQRFLVLGLALDDHT